MSCDYEYTTSKEAEPRKSVLAEADKIINGQRQDSYGNPEDSFAIIRDYWDRYITEKIKQLCRETMTEELYNEVEDVVATQFIIDSVDVANMMILFKQARKLGQKPCRDNYVDSCGYEAIAADRLIKWED